MRFAEMTAPEIRDRGSHPGTRGLRFSLATMVVVVIVVTASKLGLDLA